MDPARLDNVQEEVLRSPRCRTLSSGEVHTAASLLKAGTVHPDECKIVKERSTIYRGRSYSAS